MKGTCLIRKADTVPRLLGARRVGDMPALAVVLTAPEQALRSSQQAVRQE